MQRKNDNANQANVSRVSSNKEKSLQNMDSNAIVSDLTSHIPFWGGFFMYRNKKIQVVNTCTIDCYLFSIWVMSKLIPDFVKNLPQLDETKNIEVILSNIEKGDRKMARQNWYTQIMNEDIAKAKKIDFYGEIEQYFLKNIYIFQTHSLLQNCSKDCIYTGNMII